MKVHVSGENYLETIYVLSQRLPEVRSIDVVNELHYSKPSISVAMKNLREKELITMDNDGHIHLTDAGKEIAVKIYERHILLSNWLMYLGVDEATALEDACKLEHHISPQSFEAIKKHVTKFNEVHE